MAEEAQVDGFTESETQFFESGGEVAPEAIEGEVVEQQEEIQQEPAGEVAEQAQEEAVPEVRPEPQPEKTVPLAALHEERARRKEMSARMQAMEERFGQVLQKLDAKDQPSAPDFEDEPLEALKFQTDQISKQLEQQNATLAQQQQNQQEQDYKAAVVTNYQQDAARFQETAPDFMDAYRYMQNSRATELAAIGYSQAEVVNIIQNEELGLAAQALQNEMSPAEILYNMAKARGYTQQQAPAHQDKSAEEIKMDMAAKGVDASRSLSSAGGKSEKDISLESLADMDDDEFDKNWDKLIGS